MRASGGGRRARHIYYCWHVLSDVPAESRVLIWRRDAARCCFDYRMTRTSHGLADISIGLILSSWGHLSALACLRHARDATSRRRTTLDGFGHGGQPERLRCSPTHASPRSPLLPWRCHAVPWWSQPVPRSSRGRCVALSCETACLALGLLRAIQFSRFCGCVHPTWEAVDLRRGLPSPSAGTHLGYVPCAYLRLRSHSL